MSEPTTERPSSMRLWLARYKPDRVRCQLRDGTERDLAKPATSRGCWSQLEKGITALNPSYIEAFVGETCVASRGNEDEEVEPQVAAPPAVDPMGLMVQQLPTIVQLIVDASDRAAERHQDSYKLSFDSLLQLVKVLSDRLGGLERAWHKMNLDRAAEMGAAASAGGDNDQAAMGLLGTILQRNGASKPNGASASASDTMPPAGTDD